MKAVREFHGFEALALPQVWFSDLGRRLVLWSLLVLASAIYCIHMNYMQVDAIEKMNQRQEEYQQLRQTHQQLLLERAQWLSQKQLAVEAQARLGMHKVDWSQAQLVKLR